MSGKVKPVYIGGSRYSVSEVDKLYGPHRKGSTILGQFNPRNGTIKYLKRLGIGKNTTLIHETLHGIAWEHDIRLDECCVDIISRELSSVLGQLGVIK